MAKNMKGSMQIDGDDNHTKKGNKDLCGLEMLNRLFKRRMEIKNLKSAYCNVTQKTTKVKNSYINVYSPNNTTKFSMMFTQLLLV